MIARIHSLPFLIFVSFALNNAIPVMGQHVQEKIKPGLFVENKGQWNNAVLFRSELPSGQLYVERDRFLFNFWDGEAASKHHVHHGTEEAHSENKKAAAGTPGRPMAHEPVMGHAYEVRFLGCNPITAIKGESPASYQYNYFKGEDKSKWAGNINAYQSTLLENIYPGTHLKCFGQETGFKYEFHLQPGSDASLIRLQYSGVDSIYLKNGELMLHTSVNTLIEQKPFSYQIINGQNIEVACKFVLKDSLVTFAFPKGYNKKYPLVIDPQLVFSTYSGSYSDNWGNTATYDDDGNAYMVGIVFGPSYPKWPGAYQIVYNGSNESVEYSDGWYTSKMDPDLAIMKFGPTGKLLYATYLGGSETEVPSSIIVNKQHQLVILGFTGSDGNTTADGSTGIPFPTTSGAYDRSFNGGVGTTQSGGPLGRFDGIFFDRGSDLFVAILSQGGNALISSTLIGGSANDGLTFREQAPKVGAMARNYGDQFRSEILCDDDDNIYIVTKTNSNNIINTSVPGYDKTFNGVLDGYVCKMDASLSSMIWDSYIGGNGQDAGYSIRVASDKSVYICGGTTSSNFPLISPIKGTLKQNDTDGFISHFSADGTSLLHSTYIGTSSYDQAFFIQLDAEENVYVFGQTMGDYPITPGAYGIPSTGQFIQKLNPSLTTSLMSTTFGNVRNKISIVPTAFLINECGNIMLSGWGGSVNDESETDPSSYPYFISTGYMGGNTYNMPLTSDAFQKVTDGSDFYLMVLHKDATELLYATYFGGFGERDHVDGGTSRFDKRGIIYQSVCASCGGITSSFPTKNAFSTVNKSGNCNNAIFKFDLTNIRAAFDVDTTKGCAPLITTVTNKSVGKNSHWDFGDGTSSDQFNPSPHTYTKPGTYTIRVIVTDLTTCLGKDTAEKTITIYPFPGIAIGLKDTTLCKNDTIALLKTCNATWNYTWSPATHVIRPDKCDALFFPPVKTTYTITVTDTNGCVKKDSITLNVAEIIKGISWENLTDCHNGKPTVRVSNPSTGPLNYIWTFGDGTSSTDQSPVHQYDHKGTYPIVLDLFNDYCADRDVGTIDIEEIKIPNIFTPNNDTHNQCFEIVGLYPGWNVEIYNVWNKRIFKNENYKNDFCGEGLSSGVYYYIVCPPTGDCCKSWVHVLY
ncbi:MAG: gliding motility-associated C-terminal domain-containing protein [Cytophagales bacterium]|nr:gliding motility-associated C-terminal domain-containing protein [Cytophaga sp.]